MARLTTKTQLAGRIALLRIGFGLIWAIDAVLKWQPTFLNSLADQINSTAQGQPAWLKGWFSTWQHFLSINPKFFAVSVALTESFIALALIIGLAKRYTYILGLVFSLSIWGVAEGFGGPYNSSSTDIGAAIIYAVVFLALYFLEQLTIASKFSLDEAIKRRISWWHIVSDPNRSAAHEDS